jgi:integrase
MSKSNFYRDAWTPTRRAAGRPELTFHDLRHTAASLLLAHSGAELAELKFVLGHSQIAHTVDLYGHLVPGRLEGTARDLRRRGHGRADAAGRARPPRRGTSPRSAGCGWCT